MTIRLARTAAAVLTTVLIGLLLTSPAQAASYRQFKDITNGYCLRPGSSDSFDVRANPCSTSPTTRRDWTVINRGKLNGHSLWQLQDRGTGRCLSRGDNGGVGYIEHQSCSQANDQIWEVFPIASGVIAFGSYGAWTEYHLHGCVTYLGGTRALNTDVRTCNTNLASQRWR
ncbi:hypothetical protein ACIA5C_47100 [Actinoplanes sp. NPDC051343]|uniref:hypothetical protein n=1 Tax=Actinoplanes sp. NPDC051343 TaxID=3363906 RepID=UPI00379C546A